MSYGTLFREYSFVSQTWNELHGELLKREAKLKSRGKKNKDLKWEKKKMIGHQYFEESTYTTQGIRERGKLKKNSKTFYCFESLNSLKYSFIKELGKGS